MPDKILATILFALFIITGGISAYAQIPTYDIQMDNEIDDTDDIDDIENIQIVDEDEIDRANAANAADETDDINETELQPEDTEAINITLKDNLLSVNVLDVTFEEIIRKIAAKAAFRIDGHSNFFSKIITTKFNDLEVDKGIIRIFSLAKEKNYLIYYNTKGAVTKLEIYGAETAGNVPAPVIPNASPLRRRISPPPPQPLPPLPVRPVAPGISPSRTRAVPGSRAPVISQPVPPEQISDEDQDNE